jgi:hypothetical protein
MKDSEYLTEIKARMELESMGCKLIKCPKCDGRGYIRIKSVVVEGKGTLDGVYDCRRCKSRGVVWVTPNESIFSEETVMDTVQVPIQKDELKIETI